MKQAFVTLLSSKDYLPAVLILNRNLKKLKCQHSLITLVTEDIFDSVLQYLEKEDMCYKKVPIIQYPEQLQKKFQDNPNLINTASKLNIFNMNDLDKVVYIDADSYFLKSIDELFTYPDGAMYECFGKDGEIGFSGMFVCCPKYHFLEFYKTLLTEHKLLDGSLLGSLWFQYRTNKDYHIPPSYFILMRYEKFNSLIPIKENIFGVHFCSMPKPWKYTNLQEYISILQPIFSDLGQIRFNILSSYFTYYIQPLFTDYPELFK